MELIQLKSLIETIQALPSPSPHEPTIFSIGARGHFENPTTDVLAFFLDNSASHGLGSIALKAILELLPEDKKRPRDVNLVSPPQREVPTAGGRIDLLLESDDWVMVLENKLFHSQNNPFEDYQEFARGSFSDKEILYVVLSPSGAAPQGWHGISYPILISNLKDNMAFKFIDQPLNKWLVLLREFVLHLEQLMKGNNIPKDTSDFILDNLEKIHEIQKLKERVVNDFQDECKCYLEEVFPDEEVVTRLHHWSGFPALRFSLAAWSSQSDVVLYLDNAEYTNVQSYICELDTSELHQSAEEIMSREDCYKHWTELKGSIAGFQTLLPDTDKASMFRLVAERMKLVDRFERDIRSQEYK